MNKIKYYLEFSDWRKRNPVNNVVAVFIDKRPYCGGWNRCYEAFGSISDCPNSQVAGTSVSTSYLRAKCRRVSAAKARKIHPALFDRLTK